MADEAATAFSAEDRSRKISSDWKSSDYYERAERTVGQFWDRNGRFRPMFEQLDLAAVLELACGHGRHVPRYLDRAGEVTLVDVNVENIDICRQRFPADRVRCIVNAGNDLPGVADESLTAIFSYDAMVHFELFDIFAYLQEFRRCLKPGGQVLLHHSNFTGQPEDDYSKKPHWRNFMSAELMRYLVSRAGLQTVEQRIVDWGTRRKCFAHDCLSLLRRAPA